jgi:ribosomal protein S11
MAIADLYGKILAMGAMTIRNHTPIPALVNHTSSEDPTTPKTMGGTVSVIVPPEYSTRDVTPGSTAPASQGQPNPTTVNVPLDHWKEVNFNLTERDITQMENNEAYVPMFLSNAAAAIADDVSASIFANYKGVYGFTGTPGTTPFATSTVAAQDAKKILTEQKCPKLMRHLVLDTDAYANATGLPAFQSAFNSGDTMTIQEGEIGRKLGFNWHEDVNAPTHTAGAAAGYLVNQADHAIGDLDVTVDTGTGSWAVGDIFTVAGDSQTYVVTSSSSTVMNYKPKAKTAFANNAAITKKASHQVSLAFNPFAMAFVSRPNAQLNLPELRQGKVIGTFVDDMTGVVLKLVIADEYHQTGFYLSCLWGTQLVDERLITRIAG